MGSLEYEMPLVPSLNAIFEVGPSNCIVPGLTWSMAMGEVVPIPTNPDDSMVTAGVPFVFSTILLGPTISV